LLATQTVRGAGEKQSQLSFSRCGTPARPEPRQFISVENQPRNHLAHNVKGLVPSRITSAVFRLLGLAIVREYPLLPVRILEVPDVQGRVVAVDDRRITTFRTMVVSYAKERFRHGFTMRLSELIYGRLHGNGHARGGELRMRD
jgi:hypothetical protein